LPRFSHPSERLALRPRGPALPVAPLNEVASCPASCILRLCRRPSFRLPRLSRPLALPGSDCRLPRSPLLRSRLPMLPPGCPGFCIFRPCRRSIFELPRISYPSAPLMRLPGVSPAAPPLQLRLPMLSTRLPRLPHLPALPATDPRVTPQFVSFGAAGAAALGCPSAPRFQLRLPVGLQVAPHSTPSGFALGSILRVAPLFRSLGAG
jgi:hypothetical protein